MTYDYHFLTRLMTNATRNAATDKIANIYIHALYKKTSYPFERTVIANQKAPAFTRKTIANV